MSLTIMPKIPLPNPGPEGTKILEKALRFFADVIIGKLSDKIGRSKSQNQDSSAEDISKMYEILEEYKDQVHKEALNVESKVMEEVNYYVDELNNMFGQNDKIFVKYKINYKRIEKNIQSAAKRMQGSIDSTVCRMVSLDNSECRKILQMIPGSKKEQAMKEFMQQTIKRALNQYCEEFREGLSELLSEAEDEIVQAVEKVGKEMERQAELLETVNNDNYTERTCELIADANGIIALCGLAQNCLEVR